MGINYASKERYIKREILSKWESSIKGLLCIRVWNSKHKGRRGYSPYLRSSWKKIIIIIIVVIIIK